MSELRFNNGTEIYYANITKMNPYTLVSNAYNGDGIIADGSALIPFSRETFYTERKAISSYRNYTKPIVNSIIEPVFDAPVKRVSNSELFDAFLEDVDNRGTTMTNNSSDVVTLARLHGVAFVVMDNFRQEEIPATVSEVIDQRKLPYIYTQAAYTVKDYKTDYFGNIRSITFTYAEEVIDGKKLTVTVTWDSMNMIKEYWDGDKLYKVETNTHGLGVIPVISVYSTNRDKVLPMPPFYDLAKLNISLFNKDSELRDQERAQAFSVFYAQLDTNNGNITIGPHAMMVLPLDPNLTISPGYASPASDILKHLMDSSTAFVNSIYQMAGQNGIVGIKSMGSGIAEAYKFRGTNTQLKKTAGIAEDYEKALADLFSKYTGIPIEYEVSYTQNYDTFYNQMTVDDVVKLMNLPLPLEVKNEIKKVVVHTYLDNLDNDKQEELDAIIDKENVSLPVAPMTEKPIDESMNDENESV